MIKWLAIIMLALSLVGCGSEPTPTPAPPAPDPTATPEPAPTPTPATLEERISSLLSDRNRDVQPAFTVDSALDVLNVTWPLNDSFEIKKSAMMDAAAILRAIHEQGDEYGIINLTGTFDLIDAGGNHTEAPVVWIEMGPEAMAGINWEDRQFVEFVLYQRLPEIADSLKYHPAMDEEN